MSKISNVEFLNSIREVQTQEYRNVIPQVKSNDDCLQVLATFAEYPTAKNAFISTLTNRVGKSMFFDKVFKNPYKMLHRGMLEYGKSIEQLFTEMAEKKGWNEHFTGSTTEEGDLIKAVKPSVKVDYITQNFEYKFKTSISDQQLRGAFQNPYGLQSMLQHAVDSLASSVDYAEYVDIKALISKLIVDFTTASIKENIETPKDEAGAKKFVKAVRRIADEMTFPSTKYNTAGVLNWSKKSDLVLFTTPAVKAELDVELLAQAFNVSYADVPIRIITVDELPKVGSGTQYQTIALLADRELLQIYDTINTTSTFYNPERLTTNYFAHKHGLMAGCKFAQGIAIIDPTAQ